MTDHAHPHASSPHIPPSFDLEKFRTFCSRGFSSGIGEEQGQVCVEAAISLCSGEGLSDEPTCVHPDIRSHAIALNDASWSSPEARAAGLCDYGLAQLGTASLDGEQFARRLAYLTITRLLPATLRAAGLAEQAQRCESAEDLEQAARAADADAADAAADAAYAAADAAADPSERDQILTLSATLAIEAIEFVRAGGVQK